MVRARASAVRSRSVSGLGRDGRALAIAPKVPYTQIPAPGNALWGARPKTSFQLIKTCSNA